MYTMQNCWLLPLLFSTLILSNRCAIAQRIAGDGITDDTIAIQAAIDRAAVSGGEVRLAAGTSIISAQLTNRPNVRLVGFGPNSIIKRKDGTVGNMFVNSATGDGNMELLSFTIDANKPNTPNQSTYALRWTGVTNCLIDRVHLKNGQSGFVIEEGSSFNTIQGLVIDSYGTYLTGAGIFLFRGCSNNIVFGNVINNGGTNTSGIMIDDESGGVGPTSKPSNGNLVLGNIINDGQDGIDIEGSSDNIVQGNIITRMYNRAIVVQHGFSWTVSKDNLISGNIISVVGGVNNYAAIQVEGQGNKVENNKISKCVGLAMGISIEGESVNGTNQSNAEISNNQLVSIPSVGIRIAPSVMQGLNVHGNSLKNIGDIGIYATGSGTSWIFSGNTVISNANHGIYIIANVPDVSVSQNEIRNVGSDSIGIIVQGEITNVILQSNDIIDTRPTPLMSYGLKLDGVTGNTVDQLNNVFGFTVARSYSQ